jgi:hypothetical protein
MRLRGERDKARQEHDGAQQQVSSLHNDLKRKKVQKLEAESVSTGLAKGLA